MVCKMILKTAENYKNLSGIQIQTDEILAVKQFKKTTLMYRYVGLGNHCFDLSFFHAFDTKNAIKANLFAIDYAQFIMQHSMLFKYSHNSWY